jgi:hypothetical protein
LPRSSAIVSISHSSAARSAGSKSPKTATPESPGLTLLDAIPVPILKQAETALCA